MVDGNLHIIIFSSVAEKEKEMGNRITEKRINVMLDTVA